jgi:hypothetical protein
MCGELGWACAVNTDKTNTEKEHPTFNIQRRTSNTDNRPTHGYWMLGVGCWMFKEVFTP